MKKRFYKVLLITLLSLLFTFLYIKFLILIGFKCPIKKIFNIYCAGCGTTRMILNIIKFNFYKAFKYNQLMFITFIILIIYILIGAYKYIKYNKIISINIKVLVSYLIVCIIFMILRNISQFSYLSPNN